MIRGDTDGEVQALKALMHKVEDLYKATADEPMTDKVQEKVVAVWVELERLNAAIAVASLLYREPAGRG